MLITARKHLTTSIYLLLAIGQLAFWGCAATHSSRSEIANTSTVSTNAINPAAPGNIPPEYRIGILDELEIRVRYHERLNNTVKVRPDGRITLEDLGDILVAGMTPGQLDSAITDLYSKTIHEPETTVFVRNFANLAIYVLGEVRTPGSVEMKPKMTVLQAVAAASGPIRGAKMNSVMMLRRDAAGELKAVRLDLTASRVKNAAYQDFTVQPEDIIFVPKTFIANANDFLTQVYDGLLPPIDVYLRALRIQVRTN
jgi:protein involved in polysaccharide export with SLBB domain